MCTSMRQSICNSACRMYIPKAQGALRQPESSTSARWTPVQLVHNAHALGHTLTNPLP